MFLNFFSDEDDENQINEMDDEYEGEKEDPYKSGKQAGMDEDNEVEDFQLPENLIETEEMEEEGSEGKDDADDISDRGGFFEIFGTVLFTYVIPRGKFILLVEIITQSCKLRISLP